MGESIRLPVQNATLQHEIDTLIPAVEAIPDKESYIRNTIIPALNDIMRHGKYMTKSHIIKRIGRTPQAKEGEYVEFREAVESSGEKLTAEVALEIADMTYFLLQPNYPRGNSPINLTYFNDFLILHHISQELAETFCVIKYTTRLLLDKFTFDKSFNRAIEKAVMQRFLEDRGLVH